MNWPQRIAALFLLGSMGSALAVDPMTFQELSLRLRMGDTPQLLLAETTQRKLMEALSPDQEVVLKKAGVTQEWLTAIEAPALVASPEVAAAFQARKRQAAASASAEAQATPPPGSTPPPQITTQSQEKLRETDIVKVGDHAPDFISKTTEGKAAKPVQPNQRLTLLVFVSSQSPVSIKLLTLLEANLQSKLGSAGLAIVALGSGQTAAEMAEMGRAQNLTFTLAEDPKKEITALYAKDYLPRCYVIDRHGIVKFTSVGLNKEDLVRLVNIIQSDLR